MSVRKWPTTTVDGYYTEKYKDLSTAGGSTSREFIEVVDPHRQWRQSSQFFLYKLVDAIPAVTWLCLWDGAMSLVCGSIQWCSAFAVRITASVSALFWLRVKIAAKRVLWFQVRVRVRFRLRLQTARILISRCSATGSRDRIHGIFAARRSAVATWLSVCLSH